MKEQRKRGRGFYAELRRRHVVRTALAYAAMVFVVLQLGEIIFPAFQTTAEADHLIRLLVVGAVLLFPVVVVMAWVYEITPMGIRSMADVDSEAGLEPHGSLSHRAALMGITIAAVASAAVWWQQTEEWVPDTRGFRTAAIFEGAQTTDAEGPVNSLAVLPLEDLSAEPGQEYFAPGMHEALLSELGQIDFLRVISRTSVMQYQPQGRSVSQIGQDLNVDAIVEGSVLRAEGSIRITVQLIHAASDTHLWSQSYERDLENVIQLQREVAESVSQEIQMVLRERSGTPGGDRLALSDGGTGDALGTGLEEDAGPDAERTADGLGETAPATLGSRSLPTSSGETDGAERVIVATPVSPPAPASEVWSAKGFTPEMQEAFMKGRVALFQAEPHGGEEAEEFFRTVLEVDSSFVPALAGLAGALLARGGDTTGVDVHQIETAWEVASKAVELAPEDREALEVLRSTEEALEVLRGAGVEVRLSPPTTQLGQLVQERVARIEVREGPSDGRNGVRSFVRLVSTGRLDEAETLGTDLVERGVDDLVLWEGMEQLNRLQKDPEGLVEVRALRYDRRGKEPGGSIRELVERMERQGAEGYWIWKVDEARARAEGSVPVYRTSLATAQLALGNPEAALATLGEAVAAREPAVATLRHDPVWDAVRADPAYQGLLRRVWGGAPSRPGDYDPR